MVATTSKTVKNGVVHFPSVLKIPALHLVLKQNTDVTTTPTRRTIYDSFLRLCVTRTNGSLFTNVAHPLSARTNVKRLTTSWKLDGIVRLKCGTSASTVL